MRVAHRAGEAATLSLPRFPASPLPRFADSTAGMAQRAQAVACTGLRREVVQVNADALAFFRRTLGVVAIEHRDSADGSAAAAQAGQ